MRFAVFTLVAMAALSATPAYACRCAADPDGARAQAVLADPSISVGTFLVRGANNAIHQSMLETKSVRHGGLVVPTFRARFGATSCAVIPVTGQTRDFLIKAEEDATYSIVGDCESSLVLNYLKSKKEGQ